MKKKSVRHMRVNRIRFAEDCCYTDEVGKNGYELLFENEDGSYSWSRRAACATIDGVEYIPAVMVEALLEMAWQGFVLTEEKEWTRKTIRGEEL